MKQLNFCFLLFALLNLTGCWPGCRFERDRAPNKNKLEMNAEKKEEQKLRLALPTDPITLDPAAADDFSALQVISEIYEPLYQYATFSEEYRIIPLIAADLPSISSDQLTVRIPIRNDITYAHDLVFGEKQTRTVTAHDFIYAFKRLALPALQSRGWWAIQGHIEGLDDFRKKILNAAPLGLTAQEFILEKVSGLTAPDPYTLVIKLTRPFPGLPHLLTQLFTAPMAAEAVALHGNANSELAIHPVGTGPFQLEKWNRGKQILLTQNESFRKDFFPLDSAIRYKRRGLLIDAGKQLPFLNQIQYSIEENPSKTWALFQQGLFDLAHPSVDDFSNIIAGGSDLKPEFTSKGQRLTLSNEQALVYVSINMRDETLGNTPDRSAALSRLIRQALSSSLNRELWLSAQANGEGSRASSILPLEIPGRPVRTSEKAALIFDFDVSRAKKLLKQAGYAEGKGLPTLTLEMRNNDPLNRQLGAFFTDSFAAIGIKLEIHMNTFEGFMQKIKTGRYQLAMGYWHLDSPDAENIFRLLVAKNRSPGPNDAHFENSEFDRLYTELTEQPNGPKRSELIKKMDTLIQMECPWLLGYYPVNHTITQPWVKNLNPGVPVLQQYKYLRIDRSESQNAH